MIAPRLIRDVNRGKQTGRLCTLAAGVAVGLTLGTVTHRAVLAAGASSAANQPGLQDDLQRARARETHWRGETARWRRTALHKPTVAEAITIASVVYQVPRRHLEAVAWCESRWTPTARNGPYRGLMQEGPMFEAGPFGRAGLSVWSPYANALTAARVVAREGWRQWECQP